MLEILEYSFFLAKTAHSTNRKGGGSTDHLRPSKLTARQHGGRAKRPNGRLSPLEELQVRGFRRAIGAGAASAELDRNLT